MLSLSPILLKNFFLRPELPLSSAMSSFPSFISRKLSGLFATLRQTEVIRTQGMQILEVASMQGWWGEGEIIPQT